LEARAALPAGLYDGSKSYRTDWSRREESQADRQSAIEKSCDVLHQQRTLIKGLMKLSIHNLSASYQSSGFMDEAVPRGGSDSPGTQHHHVENFKEYRISSSRGRL
jgi:hypothetical protein